MRTLFEIDKKDYITNGTVGFRPSARGIIAKDGKLAMIHSLEYDYYKFPGGGIGEDESHAEALIREVREEAGLEVIPASIREYGYVKRTQKGSIEDIFVQENFYYLCEVKDIPPTAQNLDDYESEEKFTLEYVTPEQAIETNRHHGHKEKSDNESFITLLERENRVLEIIINENITNNRGFYTQNQKD